MCTRTSNKLKNTLSKKAGTSSRCTPLARIYDNSNAEFHKNTYFLRSLSAVIQVYTTTSACVCENATTVVEITSARRTHFTMRRRPSDVEGATRNAIRSQTHLYTRFSASATPGALARRDRRAKVTGLHDAPSEFKKKSERAPLGLSRQCAMTSHERLN